MISMLMRLSSRFSTLIFKVTGVLKSGFDSQMEERSFQEYIQEHWQDDPTWKAGPITFGCFTLVFIPNELYVFAILWLR